MQTGAFVTKIFHPNVSNKGEICVNTLKKDWQPEMGIRHVLLTIKCLLINPNPESALNEEAGRLLIEKYEDYFKHAKLMTSVHGTKLKWEDAPSSTEAPAAASSSATTTTQTDDVSGEEDEKCKENSVPARSASSNTIAAAKTAKPATATASSSAAAVPKANSAAALKQKKSLKRL
jgi:ubiquitin-conjugating enzyme E2 S